MGAMFKHSLSCHGKINVNLDDDRLTMDIEGPLNIEFFQQMQEKLKVLKTQLDINNYTCLVILHGEALATPEAMAYFTQYLKTVQARAVAINLQYVDSPAITRDICQLAYENSGINYRFFLDNNSAITWLSTCMAVSVPA